MARQAQNQANQTYQAASNLTGGATAAAGGLYNQLNPFYSSEMTNPQGFSPTEMTQMNTGMQQGTGGAEAGAIEQGNLRAARNRNTAGVTAAADDAARNAMKASAEGSLGVNLENAKLKRLQQQAGAEGENRLFNTENQDVLASLGLRDQATQTGIQAGKSGWFQNMLGLIGALKPGGGYNSGTGEWSATVGG